ncbi:MAG: hypothetical protein ACRD0O_21395, partial [Acidimicrobiia bacterium]
TIMQVPKTEARVVIAVAILLAMPMFTVFASLSDRIGRKWIIMAGCGLGAVFYLPIYHAMVRAANTGVVTLAEAKNAIGERTLGAFDAAGNPVVASTASDPNYALLVLLVFIQMIFVCMVYGPMAAFLVEAFPAKVRYTSLSLPYHIGNGVFGGLVPITGLYVCAATKSLYAGLIYPITIAAITFIVGSLVMKETRDVRIWDELEALRRGEEPAAGEPSAGATPAPAT